MQFTHDEIQKLPRVLSAPRFATYLSAQNGNKEQALQLYQWNLEISAAFFIPLQVCEISLRNSIVQAIEMAYGANRPWEKSFEISLRSPPSGYNPRRNLADLRHLPTSGKIIAELKFVFWEKMLTSGHDGVLWNPYFRQIFPNTDQRKTVQALRGHANQTILKIRELRNRIAHHEPIFNRPLHQDYQRIHDVISWTDLTAATWTDKIQTVTDLIRTKP